MADRVSDDGRIPGRLDADWNGTVDWDCLTRSAQLANLLLAVAPLSGTDRYVAVAHRILQFLKRTQNCVTNHDGLRGGIKGAYPFSGEYCRYEVLNWPTKFYLDALILDDGAADASELTGA